MRIVAVGDRDVPIANRVETKNWWCHLPSA